MPWAAAGGGIGPRLKTPKLTGCVVVPLLAQALFDHPTSDPIVQSQSITSCSCVPGYATEEQQFSLAKQ
jgi:hypothetical protein